MDNFQQVNLHKTTTRNDIDGLGGLGEQSLHGVIQSLDDIVGAQKVDGVSLSSASQLSSEFADNPNFRSLLKKVKDDVGQGLILNDEVMADLENNPLVKLIIDLDEQCKAYWSATEGKGTNVNVWIDAYNSLNSALSTSDSKWGLEVFVKNIIAIAKQSTRKGLTRADLIMIKALEEATIQADKDFTTQKAIAGTYDIKSEKDTIFNETTSFFDEDPTKSIESIITTLESFENKPFEAPTKESSSSDSTHMLGLISVADIRQIDEKHSDEVLKMLEDAGVIDKQGVVIDTAPLDNEVFISKLEAKVGEDDSEKILNLIQKTNSEYNAVSIDVKTDAKENLTVKGGLTESVATANDGKSVTEFLDSEAAASVIDDIFPNGTSGLSDEQIIAKIYNYLLDNYNWESDDIAGTDWNTVLETIQNKGGDCEDLANLFASLCLAAGIDDSKIDVYVDIGSDDKEGHVVVGYQSDSGTIILDISASLQAVAQLHADRNDFKIDFLSDCDTIDVYEEKNNLKFDFSYDTEKVESTDGNAVNFGDFEGVNSKYSTGNITLQIHHEMTEADLTSDEWTVDELYGGPQVFVYKGTSHIMAMYYKIANSINRAYWELQCSVFTMFNQGLTIEDIMDLVNSIREMILAGAMDSSQGLQVINGLLSGANAGLLMDALKNPESYAAYLEGTWAEGDDFNEFASEELADINLDSDQTILAVTKTDTVDSAGKADVEFAIAIDAQVQAWASSVNYESWTQDYMETDYESEFYDPVVSDPGFGGVYFRTINYEKIDEAITEMQGAANKGIAFAMVGEALTEINRIVIQIMFNVLS